MVHLTTTDLGDAEGSLPPMGSFVYAMPDVRKFSSSTDPISVSETAPAGTPPTNVPQVRNDRNVISTALATSGSSIDYATRMAKILARKFGQPVYVGCSMNFAGTTAEEEMEGFAAAVDQIMQRWTRKI
jgi:hypothetical protein